MEHTLKILAPAGDEAMLRAAVFSGADSVYLGVKGFNARRTAANFEGDGLAQAVAFCHARNCRVYAAINTLVLPGREEAMRNAVALAAEAGCDAVIVQDLATALAVRQLAPGLALHASTQMSVHSLAGVEQLAALGFERAILARELTEGELAHIAAHSPIELEVFVHGALCVSVSGQCTASAFLGGRSANRGGCAGPCRLPFRALCTGGWLGGGGNRQHAPAENDYHLSMKDLSILDALPRLERMGIVAAKIEGRLRGPEYCAVAVDCARKALDGQPWDRQLLKDIFSRSGFTGGWFTGEAVGDGSPSQLAAHSAPDPPNGRCAAYPSGAPLRGALRETSGASCSAALQPSQLAAHSAPMGTRTEADAAATKRALPKARELYRRERPRVPVEMALRFGPGGGALTATDGTFTVRREIAGPLPTAENDPAPALAAALAKTGGTPFFVPEGQSPAVESGGAFLPAAAVTALRREALEELLALRAAPRPRKTAPQPGEGHAPANGASSWGPIGAKAADDPLLAETFAQKARFGRPALWARFEHVAQLPENAAALCAALVLPLAEAGKVPEALRPKTWLWLPRVLFGVAEARAAEQVAKAAQMGFAGFEAGNLAHYTLCAGHPMLAGFGLNLANAASVAAAMQGCRAVTLSPELSLAQLRQLAGAKELNGAPSSARSGSARTTSHRFAAGSAVLPSAKPASALKRPSGAASPAADVGCSAAPSHISAPSASLCSVAPRNRPAGLVPALSALAYGHLPLMLTRACPLQNAPGHGGCAGCAGRAHSAPSAAPGALIDRTGRAFPLACRDGARTLYNPVPLWMADRLAELPADIALLYFTLETAPQAGAVLAAFAEGRPAPGEFTRGLYDRGTEE